MRAFALFALLQGAVAFIEWGYRQAATLERAQQWVDAGALWPLVPAALFALTAEVAWTGKKRPALPMRVGTFLPAAFFLVAGFAVPGMRRIAVPTSWGFEYEFQSHWLMNVALVWAMVLGVVTLLVVVLTIRRGAPAARRLSRGFLRGIAVLVLVNLLHGVLWLLFDLELPSFSTLGTLLLVGVIAVSLQRYGAMELAPQFSAGTILTTIQDGVVLTDETSALRYLNPAAQRLFRLDGKESVIGRAAAEVLPRNSLEPTGTISDEERTLRRHDGSEIRVAFSSAQVTAPFGGRVYVFRDISERARFQARLRHLAYHDALTGLGNREAFQEDLALTVTRPARAGEDRRCSVLVLVDLDRFKEVNDAYGHAAGDTVLIEVARRLQETARAEDRAYRLGGDEFAVLLHSLRDGADSEQIVEKIRRDLELPMILEGAHLEPEVSTGYTLALPGEDETLVLARADAALYEAKKVRGGTRSFAPGDLLPTTRRGLVHRIVRDAARNRDFAWHFQPIVDEAGTIQGAEILARLSDAGGNPVSPAEFIPAAEESGLITELGRQAREEAVRFLDLLEWPEDFHVTVNVSPQEITRPETVDEILAFLRQHQAFSSLHLEITETEVLELGPSGRARLQELVAAGVKLYVDDFGSGYSSLGRLRTLPVSTVKVDRSFLLSWEGDERARALVEGTIRLIRGLGLEVVAEGVESSDQLDVLRRAGCRRFQGYYFHRPMPGEDLLPLMRQVLTQAG